MLKLLLECKSMARSTFYYHLSRLNSIDKYADIRERIISIYHQHKGRYGYRRILMTLHNEGFTINHKTVERIMKKCGIKSIVRIKKYRSYKGKQGKIAPNIFKRNFVALQPNTKWVTDVTEFSLCGVKRYLSPIMDLYNGEIISYTISDSPNLLMVTSMLDKAMKIVTKGEQLTVHSDQGWQYQHIKYQEKLKEKGVKQSMSRKGNCLDNASMENFFGILKSELFYLEKFRSIEEFTDQLIKYIEYYNNDRIKAKLKGMSPVKFRTHYLRI